MKVIEPMNITDAVLAASNIPENDHPVWDGMATYAADDLVILTTTHRVYQAVAASTGQDPATDDGTYWLDVGATNRWKAFDHIIADLASRTGSITFTLAPTEIVDGMAFFGLDAASVRVVVKDASAATVYDRTEQVVDRTEQVDWWSWFFDPIEFDTEAMFTGLPGYAGNTIEITVSSAGTARVGEIVTGRIQTLGETLVDTTVGFIDYSLKERDAFGYPIIVPRGTADRSEFRFSFPTEDARRVKRICVRLRATPAVYYADDNTTGFGTTVYGFNKGLEVPLTTNRSFAMLEVEGLV